MTASRKSAPRYDVLYCGKFPKELKERCEGIAGFLGKTITDFVAEILEHETKDLIEHHEAIKRWYEDRKKADKLSP
jgi:predicted DNA-binding protein